MQVLKYIPKVSHPHLLVGMDTSDDAAIYRLSDDVALVETVDFFPPMVDDPYMFGAIAVANAVSDVYAKGGRPLLGLNLVCFPAKLPKEILGQILKGGADKAQESGLLIVGGHTIDDAEPKYGVAVTGIVEPGRYVPNSGAKPGDQIILTKPLGSGTIATASKKDAAPPQVLQRALEVMGALNRKASEVMVKIGANACTDVTGFGFIGHLMTMMEASAVAARVRLSSVPVIQGTWELIKAGHKCGGSTRNLDQLGPLVDWHPEISEEGRFMLCDAQTSGGLLISVPRQNAQAMLKALKEAGVQDAALVGEVTEGPRGSITVLP